MTSPQNQSSDTKDASRFIAISSSSGCRSSIFRDFTPGTRKPELMEPIHWLLGLAKYLAKFERRLGYRHAGSNFAIKKTMKAYFFMFGPVRMALADARG